MTQTPSTPFAVAPSIALLLLGFAIVVAGQSARPEPRGNRGRLIDLIAAEDARAHRLRAQLDELQAHAVEVERTAAVRQQSLSSLQAELDAIGRVAGAYPVQGPGVVVELRDSALRQSSTGDPNDLVVHEQDLQAIVNALWAGGAEAMTINGERIIATSAVRCVGNTLLLHGTLYAPPYRVAAIGDPIALRVALGEDPLVSNFRIFAQEFKLGFNVHEERLLEFVAFRGIVATRHARVHPA